MTEELPQASKVKLARAQQNSIFTVYPHIEAGLKRDYTATRTLPYRDSVRWCRFFYRRDPIASTVVNRIAEITATPLRNKRRSIAHKGDVPDAVFEVYNAVARRIQPYLTTIILSYLIDGMAIPQYDLVRIMGSAESTNLGRTRYYVPDKIWLRDPTSIKLMSTFQGGLPRAYMEIPSADINFVKNKGIWPDGTIDRAAYDEMAKSFPEYIERINEGQSVIPFQDYIILRKYLPGNEYPIPYLEPALDALDHKRYLKMMDRSIASRAIEAFRHVKVGSDEFPADDDDIAAAQDALNQNSSVERVYNLFTNHTIVIEWVTPPMDTLLNDSKYVEANADIFFALGFPRILTVGETEKSNAADNKIASLGIISTMKSIQSDIIEWVKTLYARIATENGFTKVPTPYFANIPLADITTLIQYARDMLELKVISRDTAAEFYGSDYETEQDQIEYEKPIEPATPQPGVTPDATNTQNTEESPDTTE
jgi:hypothetical protein